MTTPVETPAALTPALYHYQDESVKWLRQVRRGILAHEPGLGKTACAIMAADLPCFVVCPASLVINWCLEILKWRPADADAFRVYSYSDPRLSAIRAKDWRTIVVDEAHYCKNPGAKRTVKVCSLLAGVGDGMAFALTGTPVPNRPIELWPLLFTLGATDMSLESFGVRYASGYTDERGQWNFRGASHLEELKELLAPHLLRYTKAEVMPQLPPKHWRVIALDLPQVEQEKAFDLASLDQMELDVAFEALSDVLHMHGVRKTPAAIEYIDDLVQGGTKVVTFAYHRDVLAALCEGLEARGHRVVWLHGEMGLAARQAAVEAFQDDSCGVQVFVGQITAAGVGLTLTASSHVVFVESSWVPAVLDQAADRCHRIGTTDSVQVDLLTISGSIDEVQLRRVLQKQRVIQRIVPENRLTPSADSWYTPDSRPTAGPPTNTKESHVTQEQGTPIEIIKNIAQHFAALGDLFGALGDLSAAVAAGQPAATEGKDEGDEVAAARTRRARKGATKDADSGESTSKPARRQRKSRAAKEDKPSGPSMDDMTRALLKVVDTFDEGDDIAAEILNDVAGVKKAKDVPTDKFQAVIDACVEECKPEVG